MREDSRKYSVSIAKPMHPMKILFHPLKKV
jgi:hypothetical protein